MRTKELLEVAGVAACTVRDCARTVRSKAVRPVLAKMRHVPRGREVIPEKKAA